MAVARTCLRCNRKFLAKKDEQYCKDCAKAELMAILNKDKPKEEPKEKPKEEPKEEPKALTKCKNCGKMFEQTGKGRPAVNCPTCRAELSKPKKKVAPKDKESKKVDEVAPVISKTETTESYINAKSVEDLYVSNDDVKDLSVTTDKNRTYSLMRLIILHIIIVARLKLSISSKTKDYRSI